MLTDHFFKFYSAASLIIPIWILGCAVAEHKTMFGTLVNLTSFKLNLLIFFNGFIVLLIMFINFLIWVFFGDIRIIEQKYVIEKSQKKIFQFLLLSIVLRNTFDIYKMLGLAILFFFCIIHWLVNKRSDYLVSRGSREWRDHFKMMFLSYTLIFICFVVSFVFVKQFTADGQNGGESIGKIYVIIGFEFIRLFLKSIQHNFKYQISSLELSYREQWIEKGFVLNISRFIFDSIILLLNAKLFLWIFMRGQFPLYLLGESIDTFIKLYKSIQLFIKSRTIVNQLNRLPDVNLQDPQNRIGVDTTCIICLEEMIVAKKLACGHIFHLACLRRWIEQNVQCPTCRTQIVLESPAAEPAANNQQGADQQAQNQARDGIRQQRRDIRLFLRQQSVIQRRLQQQRARANQRDTQQNNTSPTQEDQTQPNQDAQPDYTAELPARVDPITSLINNRDPLEETKQPETQDDPLSITRKPPVFIKQSIVTKDQSKPSEVKDIFKVTEFDVLNELGDKSNEEEKIAPRKQAGKTDTLSNQNESNQKYEDIFTNENIEETIKQSRYDREESRSRFIEQQLRRKELIRSQQEKQQMLREAKKLHREQIVKEMESLLSQQSSLGSVPYGLPTIALTRRTLDVQIKAKQIEMINDKLIRILRRPQDYIDLSSDDNSD